MRQAIIVEAKRLKRTASEIKDILAVWNGKCEKKLPPEEIKRHLFDYVDWVFKLKECRLSCKALQDYCIGEDRCQYFLRTTSKNRKETIDLPFSMEDLDKLLTKRFKADGYVMMLIVKALRFYQQDRATGEVMLVGYRTISAIVRDRWGHNLEPMAILRKMRLLIEEGVLEQVVRGKAGTFSQQANGYRFLPWRPPQPTITHINSMCNTEGQAS